MLSTTVYTAILIFKDGSTKWVTDNVYNQLLELGDDGKFLIEGGMYDIKNVAKVLTKEEYYREYPDNVPPIYTKQILEVTKRMPTKRALQCAIQGIKDYISSSDYRGTDAPKEILRSWEHRLDLLG